MKKNKTFSVLYFTLFILAFMAIGMYIGETLEEDNELLLIILILLSYVMYLLSIICHEFGHLIFGLLSGYTFSSFRVANIMLLKNHGKFELKKFGLAGTGGQCIMLPKGNNDKFILYNLGGIIINIILCVISGILMFVVKNDIVKILLFEFGIFNLFDALTNGIPFNSSIPNDMQNIIEFKKDPKNCDIFFNSLYIQNAISLGTRLKDIDKKYIYKPKNLDTNGELITMVFYCQQLMDKCEIKEASKEIENIIDDERISELYKALLISDLLYCYCILGKDTNNVLSMEDKSIKNILKSMNTYPSIIRTNYTYSLLVDKNKNDAAIYLSLFNRVKKSYPYPVEIESELELIEIAKSKYKEKDQ